MVFFFRVFRHSRLDDVSISPQRGKRNRVSILFLWPPKQKQKEEVAARIAIISALQWTLESEPHSSWGYGWFLLERERNFAVILICLDSNDFFTDGPGCGLNVDIYIFYALGRVEFHRKQKNNRLYVRASSRLPNPSPITWDVDLVVFLFRFSFFFLALKDCAPLAVHFTLGASPRQCSTCQSIS